jgi:hypothetical protein
MTARFQTDEIARLIAELDEATLEESQALNECRQIAEKLDAAMNATTRIMRELQEAIERARAEGKP